MGNYLTPFQEVGKSQQIPQVMPTESAVQKADSHQAAPALSEAAQQTPQTVSPARLLWERYSAQNSGVLAGVAAGNPAVQRSLDQAIAKQAIREGHSAQEVEGAIAQHSPAAQRSKQPDVYAKNVVGQVTSHTDKAIQPASKRAQAQSRNPSKRTKAKDNGMGY